MNDSYFYDGAGNPLTGKIPLQVTFKGTGDFAKIRGRATQILNAFLTDVRLGDLAQLTRRVEFPGGAVLMRHSFGVTKVIVYAEAEEAGVDKFFGGILIRPHIMADVEADARYGRVVENASYPWTSLSVLGPLPKAPAVPGSKDASLEWLVVQIHPTKSLQDEPIKKGAVKIYRVHDPKSGRVGEVNVGARYLVSTEDGTEFFLCGKKLEYVPPLPPGDRNVMRLRTHDLQISSFETAASADGIIIAATLTKLYLLNTKDRTPSALASWRLLADVPPVEGSPVPYGTGFETTVVDNLTQIVCTDPTAPGEFGSFSVSITRTPLGLEYAGTVNPKRTSLSDAPSEENSGTSTYTELPAPIHVDAHKFCYVRYNDADSGPLHVTPDYPLVLPGPRHYVGIELYDRHVAYSTAGFVRTFSGVAQGDRGPNAPVQFPSISFRYGELRVVPPEHLFLGRARTQPPRFRYRYEETSEVRTEFVGYEYRLKGVGLVWTPSGNAILDPRSSLGGFTTFPTWPTDPPIIGTSDALHFSSDFDPSLPGGGGFGAYYYGVYGGYMDADVGVRYDTTSELSGRYEPWNWGLGSTSNPPAGPTFFAGSPAFYKFPGQPLDSPYEVTAPWFYFSGGLPDDLEDPVETEDDWRWDNILIHFYPKRAAIFDCYEHWRMSLEVEGSIYGDGAVTVRGEYTRSGQLRADEYLAERLPTSVDSFPELSPPTITQVTDEPVPARSGTYALAEGERTSCVGYDVTTFALAWEIDAPTTVSWIHDSEPPVENHNFAERGGVFPPPRVRVTHSTQRCTLRLIDRAGQLLFEEPDLFEAQGLPASQLILTDDNYTLEAVTARPNNAAPLIYKDPEHSEWDPIRDRIRDGELLHQIPGGLLYPLEWRARPLLSVGYWGRSSTGEELNPQFLTSRVPPTLTRTAPFYFPSGIRTARIGCSATEKSIFRDPRSSGFLADVEVALIPGTRIELEQPFFRALVRRTVIGNSSGVVPFLPILQEWVATHGGSLNRQHVRLTEVALEPETNIPLPNIIFGARLL